MASLIAKKIAYEVLMTDAEQPSTEAAIDAALTEVRNFVTALHNAYQSDEEFSASTIDWLGGRAKVLHEKLRTDK